MDRFIHKCSLLHKCSSVESTHAPVEINGKVLEELLFVM